MELNDLKHFDYDICEYSERGSSTYRRGYKDVSGKVVYIQGCMNLEKGTSFCIALGSNCRFTLLADPHKSGPVPYNQIIDKRE